MKRLFYLLRRFTTVAYRIHGIGLGRLCEMIRKWAARSAPAEPLLIQDFMGRGRFWCYLREHMGSQIFFRGSYSTDCLEVLRQRLKPDSVFLDIGANHGEFSIAAALMAPLGRVIAFEPMPRNVERLQANIALNELASVRVMPVGLGDQEGTFPIHDQSVPYEDGTINEGLASLYAAGNRARLGLSIEVRLLDKLWPLLQLERVDVIKLDIEGAEWPALRGAQDILARYRPTLMVEIGRATCRAAGYNAEAFAQWLETQGYNLLRIGDGGSLQTISPEELGEFQNLLAVPSA